MASLMADDPKLTMQETVNHAAFVRNSKINDTGYSPFQVNYGRNPKIPGILEENHPLSLKTDTRCEIARTMIARQEAARLKYLEKETAKKIKITAAQRTTQG